MRAGAGLEALLLVAGTLDARLVVERLLEACIRVGVAERATLSKFEEGGLRIIATAGREGDVSWFGRTYDMATVLRQSLMQELFEKRAVVFGTGFDVPQSDPFLATALAPVQHTAIVPLMMDDDIQGMVVLSRFTGTASPRPTFPRSRRSPPSPRWHCATRSSTRRRTTRAAVSKPPSRPRSPSGPPPTPTLSWNPSANAPPPPPTRTPRRS